MAIISPSSSKATSASPPPPPPHSPLFSPIEETHRREHEKEQEAPSSTMSRDDEEAVAAMPYKHQLTPLRNTPKNHHRNPPRKLPESDETDAGTDDRTVSCNKCRPNSRDAKISVIPIDVSTKSENPSPNGLFRSILSSLTRRSPKSVSEDQWKLAVSELSHKLVQATRKRDEALLEASRLKHSMGELEKKLNKLEIYCRNLKSGLDVCSANSPIQPHHRNPDRLIIESFLNSVSDARSAVRVLSRSLTLQLRQMSGGKVYDRISSLLQPYDINGSIKNPRTLLLYLEALLNLAFHEDFERVGFQKNGSGQILNPIERSEANYSAYVALQGLTWEEVLSKGTRHFSEELSGFCDRKMSEIVAMLGWNRAWPEPLLQAFFGAAKAVWSVHLLAWSVHPGLGIFRVDKGVRFDGVYMEDMGGEKAQRLVAESVRIMVAPGYYVYSNVVKCKVICRYSNRSQGSPTS